MERLEKLPLHPDEQPDLGSEDEYEPEPGAVLEDPKVKYSHTQHGKLISETSMKVA